MERDIARIDTLIGQLLTPSRFEASLTSGTTEDVDFTLLVQEAADGNFEAQSLGKSVILEEANSVPCRMPIPLRCEVPVKILFVTPSISPDPAQR
jgi:hypothetical protein